MASCPFHDNHNSPAFAVNKVTGLYICFNPSCNARGTLERLVQSVTGSSVPQAKSLIHKHQTDVDYVALADRLGKEVTFERFPQGTLDRLREQFPGSPAEEYMRGRGFTDETLHHFDIGYSANRSLVTVPMHTDKGMPIGIIGRSITGKSFKNSKGLPKSKTAWNMHRAKREGAVGIVCEASFDAMRIHQAGYPNVVALLGGSLSRATKDQLERYFTKIVIMTDNDEAGRKLGEQIEEKVSRSVRWAVWGDGVIYPNDAKDAGDMTEEEIRRCLLNSVSSMEYMEYYK